MTAVSRLPVTLLSAVSLAVGGCAAQPPTPAPAVTTAPSPSPVSSCPELAPRYVPRGLTLRERTLVDETGAPGVRTTYAESGTGRELSFLSGVRGEVGEGGTPVGTTTVRGHRATLVATGNARVATWFERSAGQPCNQYAVIAVGLTDSEFRRVLAGIQ